MLTHSKLETVTIYREGAVCCRRASVAATPTRQVRVGGLPLSMDPGSLRATIISGPGRVVDVRPQFEVELADEVDVPAEVKALETAREALAQLTLRRTRLDGEILELERLKPKFLEPRRGDPPRDAPVAAMLELADFTDAQLDRRLAERRSVVEAVADAERDVTLRSRRVSEASSALKSERARLSRVAVVMLAEPASSPLELEVEYQVPGVRWVPAYQLKLTRAMSDGELHLRASIAQATGEDWVGVQLSLSTASLSRRTDVPELKSLRIGRRQAAAPPSGFREPPPGLDALFEGYDSARRPVAPPPPQAPPKTLLTPDLARGIVPAAPLPPPMAPPAPTMAPHGVLAGAAPKSRGTGSFSAPSVSAPAPRRARAAIEDKKVADAEPQMDELARHIDKEEASAAFGAPEPRAATAQFGLDASTLDYARLTMAGLESSSRGRLSPMGEWDALFAVGVSVQLDVVVGLVAAARQRAWGVTSLPLPANTNPVAAVDSFDYRFDSDARLDVPSTGAWVTVPVTSCEVALTPEYVCVPAVEPKVFRTLQVVNRSPHALLPGPVDVTAGDDFLLTTSLPAIPPRASATHRLGLGVEEAIKVSRKTSYKETSGGFLGGSTVLPHEIEIELNNRLASPAAIEVRERVPWVAPEDEKDVKVEEPNVQPPWEKLEQPIDGDQVVPGARRWRVTVAAGQLLKLTAQYTIRLPSDRMVVGGNRRS
jgi:Domain of unknown function (DUF4139)/N-terminal domain of unknown function (DUF4140)